MHIKVYVEHSSLVLLYQFKYFICCIDPQVILILTLQWIDLVA